MELHQLRYVLAVAENGSFSRAAEKLFVVQSNVSAQVRKLEHELGVELFERRAHEVVLTEFGRAFLPGVRQTLLALGDARQAVEAVRGLATGHVTLGVPGTVVGWLLPEALRRFRATYPGVSLWVTEESTAILGGMVASRDITQAVVNLPVRQAGLVQERELFRECFVAVVPEEHPLCGAGSAPLSAFRDDLLLLPEPGNQLRGVLLEAFASEGFTPRTSVEVGKKQVARELTLAGLGVGLLPALTAAHDLGAGHRRIVWLERPVVTRVVGLIRHPGTSLTPADSALGDTIQQVVLEHTRTMMAWCGASVPISVSGA